MPKSDPLTSAVIAITFLNIEGPKSSLKEHLSKAHDFYVLYEDEMPIFAFAKYIGCSIARGGYLSVEEYTKDYESLDFVDPEHKLKNYFEEVPYSKVAGSEYHVLRAQLANWMKQYGKGLTPRSGPVQPIRIFKRKRGP